MLYNVAVNEGIKTSITVFSDSGPLVATQDHPNFDQILHTLETDPVNERRVIDLFDLTHSLFSKFDHLSERVTVASGHIFFDGEAVNSGLADAIVQYYRDDNDDYRRLVAFMEKLATNPNEHSRENLYDWLRNNSFSIAPDGDFIAYKGLTRYRTSISSGKATVNGVQHSGQIPNEEGDIIEMPRIDVQHDPRNGCSTGLHAGTWEYASSFGDGVTIKVKINPRDVVSVPVDCGAQKLRTCRYRALEVTETPAYSLQYEYDDECWDDCCFDPDEPWFPAPVTFEPVSLPDVLVAVLVDALNQTFSAEQVPDEIVEEVVVDESKLSDGGKIAKKREALRKRLTKADRDVVRKRAVREGVPRKGRTKSELIEAIIEELYPTS